MFVAIRSTVNFLLWLPTTILHAVVCISLHKVKKATARECLTFSLRSASKFHYAKQLYGYALQFQDTFQRGWLKNSNGAQIAPVHRHSRHRKSRLGRNTLQRGWLKHGNRVQLLLHAGKAGIGCHG